jgi:alpha-beta hydrolase superfamily lysophospholipase
MRERKPDQKTLDTLAAMSAPPMSATQVSPPPDHAFSLSAQDGLMLHVCEWQPADDRQAGVVVFLHGLCGSGLWYGELARTITHIGWTFWAPDLRGHGQSGGPRAGLRKDDDLLQDAATVLDAVRQRYPHQRIVLMGHSMGGLVAGRFAVPPPGTAPTWWRDIDGAILLAPALQPTLSLTQKALLTTMGRLLLDVSLPVGIDFSWTCDDAELVARLAKDPAMHGRITPRLGLFLYREGEALQQQAAGLAVPTLLVYSMADRLVAADGCERLARQAPPALLTVKVFDKLAHSIVLEPDRAQVLGELTRWLLQFKVSRA